MHRPLLLLASAALLLAACSESPVPKPNGVGGASPSGGRSGSSPGGTAATAGSGGSHDGGAGGGAGTALAGDGGSAGPAGGGGGSGAGGGYAGSGGAGSGGAGGSDAGTGAAGTGAGSGGEAGGAADDPTCQLGRWDGTTPEPLSLSGETFAHDPTMVEHQGVFYRFWTGANIPMATSVDLRSWSAAPPVYASGYPAWVQSWLADIPGQTFNFPWAPDISRFGGTFHLYSSFSAKFGDNISCITHLTKSDLAAGSWTDHGPVVCTDGSESYNAIDADVSLDTEGKAWLAFGSFWDGIMAFPLNPDGSRQGTELTRLAWATEIEAPVLLYRCGFYYLFVTWGLCCPGEGRTIEQLTYRVAVGRSQSITGPYVARDGKPMLEGGGTLLVRGDGVEWAAAGHSDVLITGNEIYHLYHAYRKSDGGARLRVVKLPFDAEGWPVAGGP